MKTLSVVVPVLNEIEGLPRFIERLNATFLKIQSLRTEVIFVDDGSTDGSGEWLESLASHDQRVRVIKFSRNFGSYTALTAGVALASGQAAVLISADLQDPPELILELIKNWESGSIVVWAERKKRENDPLLRRITASLFYWFLRTVALPHYPPKGYDFCLIDRVAMDLVRDNNEKNTSIFALLAWARFPASAVPYDRVARTQGQTHWTWGHMFKLAVDTVLAFSVFPVRLGLWAAVVVSVSLLAYMAFLVYSKVAGGFEFPPGWPSLMTVILFTSALQLLVLAVVGEYLWRTLDQTRSRPRFVISKKIGFGS